MRKIRSYEILNHGYEHSQYFQGCGVSYTPFDDIATGVGYDAKEAYEDAVEQLAWEWDVEALPKRPRGIRTRDHVPARLFSEDMNEIYWYVSVRVTDKKLQDSIWRR